MPKIKNYSKHVLKEFNFDPLGRIILSRENKVFYISYELIDQKLIE